VRCSLIISRKSFYAAILLLFIFLTSRVDAQEPATASLTVSVTDESGAVVPRAAVTIVNEAKQTKVTKDTDENGHAALSVEPGSYRFSVKDPGFFEWHEQISVENAITRKIEVKLKVYSCPPGPCITVSPPLWWNELIPVSPPMDSVWVEQ
jgi:Carboxypeptidase regulatory-like domain